jgi:RimJ/RimL family protein N-acetyltransferase
VDKVAVTVTIERPFPTYALPRVWGWTVESRRQVADDFAVKTLDEFVNQWEAAERAGRSSWGVWRDKELGGAVTSARVNPMCVDAHCVFKRSFWGHAVTVEALRLVFEEIFSNGETQKIMATAFRDNHALLGLVRKLGFQKEGVLRQQTRRNGEMVDVVLIGLTAEGFGQVSSARVPTGAGSPQATPAEIPVATSLAASQSVHASVERIGPSRLQLIRPPECG